MTVLKDVLGLSKGEYVGFYFDGGNVYIKKYVEKD